MLTLHPRHEIEPIIAQYALPELKENYCDLIGLLHHNLAVESQAECVFPTRFDGRSEVPLYEAMQYWDTAWYMLTCLCGWSNASRGLDWFYKNDKNAQGDARLELLNTIWNSEGQLDAWALWMWECSDLVDSANIMKFKFCTQPNFPWSSPKIQPPKAWRDAVEKKCKKNCETYLPYVGGLANPLRLGRLFTLLPNNQPSNAHFVLLDKTTRRATVVMDRFVGWYEALAETGKTLPSLGEHSWHVDVFVKPLGWLGTFRRSRETGLWFQGKHSVHLAGQ